MDNNWDDKLLEQFNEIERLHWWWEGRRKLVSLLIQGEKPKKILDVGCAKGFMLYDFMQLIPGITVEGIDISKYAIENAKEEVKPFLKVGNARELPYEDNSFDLAISITTLHNLDRNDCAKALLELERVSRYGKFVTLDAYRNEIEKERMNKWNLTALTFMHVDEWKLFFDETGYYNNPGTGGNLPAGEISLGLLKNSAEGEIVFNVSFDHLGRLERNPLKISIKENRINKVEGKFKEKFECLLAQNENLRNVAEIGIGTNSSAILGRSVLEDEKKLGTAHIGFGNDTYFGGTTDGPHIDGVFLNATISIDEKLLMEDGCLI